MLEKPGEDRAGREGSRIALGRTASGRYLRVIYFPNTELDSVFAITAYDLTGKSLAAYRRRRKKKHQSARTSFQTDGMRTEYNGCLLITENRAKKRP